MTTETNASESIPQLAFGLYKVSKEDCPAVVQDAIQEGYRHFDCASSYGNEKEVGEGFKAAIDKSKVARNDLCICSKVWKDSVILGREAVRSSIRKSINDLNCDYLDIAMIHWPVPDFHVEAYKELELMVKEGIIRSIGLSNYLQKDYEDLLSAKITIHPVMNQMQISPVMYRPQIIDYFTKLGISIASHKSLHRGDCLDNDIIQQLAASYSKSPAQIMIRWGIQKNFIVVSKTSVLARMKENRNVLDFSLSRDDMVKLDGLTKDEDIVARYEHEMKSKQN